MLNSPSKKLPTQSEDVHGISKTVFTHVSCLQGLLTDWIRVRDKGNKICKTIIALKLHECTDDYFPHQLQSLTDSLLEVLESFKHINEGVAVINKQFLAIAKLQQIPQPVILTWTARDISDNVNEVYNTLLKEVSLKKVITENIAHCRDEKLLEVYATAWEIDSYFNVKSTAYLFSEKTSDVNKRFFDGNTVWKLAATAIKLNSLSTAKAIEICSKPAININTEGRADGLKGSGSQIDLNFGGNWKVGAGGCHHFTPN